MGSLKGFEILIIVLKILFGALNTSILYLSVWSIFYIMVLITMYNKTLIKFLFNYPAALIVVARMYLYSGQ